MSRSKTWYDFDTELKALATDLLNLLTQYSPGVNDLDCEGGGWTLMSSVTTDPVTMYETWIGVSPIEPALLL
jgi:hypothetical protein